MRWRSSAFAQGYSVMNRPSLQLDPREQRLRFAETMRVWQTAPLCIGKFVLAGNVELIKDFARRSWQNDGDQNTNDAQRLREHEQNMIERFRTAGVFRQLPRRAHFDVGVAR